MRWFAHVIAAIVAGLLVLAPAGCGRIDFHSVPVDAAADAVIPDAVAGGIDPCAATYSTPMGLSRYRFSATPTDWDVAEHACEADGRGSHLVVFNDTVEMNRVEAMVMGTEIWVGLTDRVTENAFLDVMGEPPSFLPGWQGGAPSFSGPGCVQFNPVSRLIRDQACATQVAYVCECDGIPAQPSSY